MATYQVRSLEEADLIIKQHERKTRTSYALLRSTRNFGCIDVPACANEEFEVRFDTVGVPYCGVPFFVAGLKILQCQAFKDRSSRNQNKKKEIKIELNSGASITGEESSITTPRVAGKKKTLCSRTGRPSCNATIIMKEVIYYPEFQVRDHSRNGRLGMARQLKEILKSRTSVQKDRIIYVTVPSSSDHSGHDVASVGSGKTTGRKLYIKNDYYGPQIDNSSTSNKRVYCPIKQEKRINEAPALPEKKRRFDAADPLAITEWQDEEGLARNLAVGELKSEDSEYKLRTVRHVLQSVMALTYKYHYLDVFDELFEDVTEAKRRLMEAIHERTGQGKQPKQTQQEQVKQVCPNLLQQITIQSLQPQQILLVKQQPGGGTQTLPAAVLAPRPATKLQQPPLLQLEQDPQTLAFTLNTVTTSANSVTALPASVTTLQGSALPTAASLAVPSFSTVVVPGCLQPSPVTLTIPSLSTLPTGSITSLHPVTLSSLTPGTLTTIQASSMPSIVPAVTTTTLPAGTLPPRTVAPVTLGTAIPIVSLSSGNLTSLPAGILPNLQPAPLPSIVAASISPIIADSVVAVPVSSSDDFNGLNPSSTTCNVTTARPSLATPVTVVSVLNGTTVSSSSIAPDSHQPEMTRVMTSSAGVRGVQCKTRALTGSETANNSCLLHIVSSGTTEGHSLSQTVSPHSEKVVVGSSWSSVSSASKMEEVSIAPQLEAQQAFKLVPCAVVSTCAGQLSASKQPSSSGTLPDSSHPETSIFIEAMEAIINSQM